MKTARQIAITHAKLESGKALARIQGMKLRAQLEPATAAKGGFPYPGRTCAEWTLWNGQIVDRQMTPAERRRDAKRGSKMLKEAILRVAA